MEAEGNEEEGVCLVFEVPTNYSCKGKFQKCAWSKISASKIFSTPILISFAYKYSANGFKVIVNYAIQIAGGIILNEIKHSFFLMIIFGPNQVSIWDFSTLDILKASLETI